MPRALTMNACGLPPGYVTRLPFTTTRRFPGVPVLIQSERLVKRLASPGASSTFSSRILPVGPPLRTASSETFVRTARSVMCAFADCGCVRSCFFCCVEPLDEMPATG